MAEGACVWRRTRSVVEPQLEALSGENRVQADEYAGQRRRVRYRRQAYIVCAIDNRAYPARQRCCGPAPP